MSDKAFNTIVFVLLCAALVAPLVVGGTLSFFYEVKTVVFRAIVIALWAVWALRASGVGATQGAAGATAVSVPRIGAVGWAFLALIAVAVLSAFGGVNAERSFFGEPSRMGGAISVLFFGGFFLALRSFVSSAKEWRRLLYVSAGVALVVAVVGLLQPVGGKAEGTIGNAGQFAGYLLPHAFLALWFATKGFVVLGEEDLPRRYAALSRWLWSGAVVIFAAAIVFSAVRGALLGLVVGGAFLLLLVARDSVRWRRFGIAAVIVAVVAGFALFALRDSGIVQSNLYLQKFTDTGSAVGTSIGNRLVVWKIALRALVDRPFLGWGVENFTAAFFRHFDPTLFDNAFKESVFDHAHSTPLGVAATMGVAGLAAYAALWGLAIRAAWRTHRLLLPLLAAVFVHSLFLFDTLTTLIPLTLIFGFIDWKITSSGVSTREQQIAETPTRGSASWVVAAVVAVLAAALWFGVIRPVNEEFAARAYRDAGGRSERMARVTEAIAAGPLSRRWVLREYADQLITEASFIAASPLIREKAGAFAAVIEEEYRFLADRLEEASAREPEDIAWRMRLGALYNEIGALYDPAAFLKAEEAAERALEVSPSRQQLHFIRAIARAGQGDVAGALEIADRAIALNPQSSEAWWVKGRIVFAAGDAEEGVRLMREARRMGFPVSLSLPTLLQAANVEAAAENWAEVAQLFETAVQRFGHDSGVLHWGLAEAYEKAGRADEALIYAQRSAQLDSTYANPAREMYQRLRP